MKTAIGRPRKNDDDKCKQFNLRLPPDIISFLIGKENKSQLIVNAIRKHYKLKNK